MIKLKDAISEVIILPSLGGSVFSYNVNLNGVTRDILRSNYKPKNVLEASCFPLVPFSNRIRNGEFVWQGNQVKVPLNNLPEKHTNHGHGWQKKWDVIDRTSSSVLLEYSHTADDWPFSYRARQEISLNDGQLEIKLTIKNIGQETMPAGLGLHPYFTRTKLSTLMTDVEKMWAVDEECMPTNITDAPSSLGQHHGMNIDSEQLDNALIGFKQKAKVTWPEWGVQAELSSSDNCRYLVVYTPKGEDFFCVEPVTHCTDAINMSNQGHKNTGVETLKLDEELNVWMTISPSAIC